MSWATATEAADALLAYAEALNRHFGQRDGDVFGDLPARFALGHAPAPLEGLRAAAMVAVKGATHGRRFFDMPFADLVAMAIQAREIAELPEVAR